MSLYEVVQSGDLERLKTLLGVSGTALAVPKTLVRESPILQDIRSPGGNNSLLHGAVISENPEILRYLLNNGSGYQMFNMDHQTPLHLAVIIQNPEMVKILLQDEFDVDDLDNEGKSPLDLAIETLAYDQSPTAIRIVEEFILDGRTEFLKPSQYSGISPMKALLAIYHKNHHIAPLVKSAIDLVLGKMYDYQEFPVEPEVKTFIYDQVLTEFIQGINKMAQSHGHGSGEMIEFDISIPENEVPSKERLQYPFSWDTVNVNPRIKGTEFTISIPKVETWEEYLFREKDVFPRIYNLIQHKTNGDPIYNSTEITQLKSPVVYTINPLIMA